MELLNFIFRLGVVFAIFNFIWFILEMLYHLVRSRSGQGVAEMYMIKMIKYFFLVEVAFLFCMDENFLNYDIRQLVICGLILIMYFIGKMQKQQKRQLIFQMQVNNQPRMLQHGFNLRAEISVIIIALAFYALFIIFPSLAKNGISIWFHSSILSIQQAPIFGFIFNVIGFFFVISIIIKMINGISFLITGAPFFRSQFNVGQMPPRDDDEKNDKRNDDDFDDYEEVK